ncbi:hypothetical protein DICPUDRAFT_155499 [Dictyostelium purpureum]|uniref:Uncharacterized protein n=1 Tax=Dictyostelium purpureum TaxID=5786 RepID=F0ZU62_DICPU|nr:uncharacterized protein DICPUDRAFT_155499 [Dictyostelium purpureum]EGC32503.1 hypothetical protein DICPUDRAFT_155499 [Dictyostelium purpureum]|eukprot:XP_003290953.1 hypothetical protein DICPUDRAFT_155499 [Dictyostelium purpureum]
MKFIYSFLILICISIITVKSQEESFKYNYFHIKKDGDPEFCRTHEEGDYSIVELSECKRGCQGYIRIYSKYLFNLIDIHFIFPNLMNVMIKGVPSNDFIKIGASGFSVLCSNIKNITTPTPSETPTITETPNETTTPKPTQSLSPSPTPKPTETASNNPTESPAGNGSLKISISLSLLDPSIQVNLEKISKTWVQGIILDKVKMINKSLLSLTKAEIKIKSPKGYIKEFDSNYSSSGSGLVSDYLNYINALLLALKIEYGCTEEKKPDNSEERKNYKLYKN